jgi:hypothetical protein
MGARPLRRSLLPSWPLRRILQLSSLLFGLSLLVSTRVMPATQPQVVPLQYPVRAINGVSYRCDDSTSAPELWLEVEWEEVDEHGNHTVTDEPWAAMEDLPIAAKYLVQPAVKKTVAKLRDAAVRRYTKNTKEAAAILAFEVQPFPVPLLTSLFTHRAHTLLMCTPFTHRADTLLMCRVQKGRTVSTLHRT